MSAGGCVLAAFCGIALMVTPVALVEARGEPTWKVLLALLSFSVGVLMFVTATVLALVLTFAGSLP